jgi:hypothetical protein
LMYYDASGKCLGKQRPKSNLRHKQFKTRPFGS